jgi:hypothetical protein
MRALWLEEWSFCGGDMILGKTEGSSDHPACLRSSDGIIVVLVLISRPGREPLRQRKNPMTAITLEALAQRIDALEQRLEIGIRRPASSASLSDVMSDVRPITQELFPGPFSCTDESDPEYPDDTYVVISVESTGGIGEAVRRRCEWHERIRALSPDLFGKLRLSINPR